MRVEEERPSFRWSLCCSRASLHRAAFGAEPASRPGGMRLPLPIAAGNRLLGEMAVSAEVAS